MYKYKVILKSGREFIFKCDSSNIPSTTRDYTDFSTVKILASEVVAIYKFKEDE